MWHIWKARNDEVFKNIKFSVFKVGRMATIFATDMLVSLEKFGDYILDSVNNK